MNVQLVTVAVETGNDEWQLYTKGVLKHCPGAQSDHAVIAVGYGTYTKLFTKCAIHGARLDMKMGAFVCNVESMVLVCVTSLQSLHSLLSVVQLLRLQLFPVAHCVVK